MKQMFCAVCLIFQQCSAVFAHSFFNFFPFTLTNYLARFCPVVHCSVNCYGSKTNKHAYISLQLAHAQTTCCVQNTLHSTLLKRFMVFWCLYLFIYNSFAAVCCVPVFQVELATGEFPYRNCTTEFEVLSRVMSEDPPELPKDGKFSKNLNTFVRTW